MTTEQIRQLSSVLYGNANRLEAAAAIGRLQGKPISAKSVAAASDLAYKRAQEQVAHFARGKVLIPDRDPNRRTKDYQALDIPYWASANKLLNRLVEEDDLP